MPDATGPRRIRSLDQGLAVVESLPNNGPSTPARLRHATGLSKATLLRLPATLRDRGWVWRNIVEGQYGLAHSPGDMLGADARAHPLAELAAPVLLEMRTRQPGLPSDLCTAKRPGVIEIIESTRLRGPLAPARTGRRPQVATCEISLSGEQMSRLIVASGSVPGRCDGLAPWAVTRRVQAANPCRPGLTG